MAEAMRFHLYTLNQMERRQEQMRILDKEIAKGLSKNFKNFSPIGPTGMHLPVILRHTHLPDQDSSWKISVKVAHFSGQTAENWNHYLVVTDELISFIHWVPFQTSLSPRVRGIIGCHWQFANLRLDQLSDSNISKPLKTTEVFSMFYTTCTVKLRSLKLRFYLVVHLSCAIFSKLRI